MDTESKILFTDLDGTLLDDHQQISIGNKKAIQTALSKGHKIVIATGRPISSAKLLAAQLDLTDEGCYIIASNGAVLYDSFRQEILDSKSFPKKYLRTLFDSAYEDGLHIHTYTHTNVLSERDTPEIKWYQKAIQVSAIFTDDVTTYLTYDPVKAILINRDAGGKKRLLQFQKKMADWIEGKMASIFSSDIMLEYCPLGVSKGAAVQNLCKLLNMPISASIAAGDAENDISMIKAAGVGCVMANGSSQTKEAADYITVKNNNEDGFAEIIEKFLL